VPSVVEFYGAFQDEEHVFIVMEYCAGGDLLEYLLRDRKAMSERRAAADVARPLLAVLARLHALRVIHRDIKLENVFIDATGRVRLGDFGLTMSMRQEAAISPVGTVEYMAPEVVALPPVDVVSSGQVRASSITPTNEKVRCARVGPLGRGAQSGGRHAAQRRATPPLPCATRLLPRANRLYAPSSPPTPVQVDIWALGVTLFELVTGRLPFEGKDKGEIKRAITSYALSPFPSYVSPHCQAMIRSMLAYRPDQRPSAEELLSHPYMQLYCPAGAPAGAGASPAVVSLSARAGPAHPADARPQQEQRPGSGGSAVLRGYKACSPSSPGMLAGLAGGNGASSREVSAHSMVRVHAVGSGRPPSAAASRRASSGAWAALRRLSAGHRTPPEVASAGAEDGSWSGGGPSKGRGGEGAAAKPGVRSVVRRLFSSRQSAPHRLEGTLSPSASPPAMSAANSPLAGSIQGA
jgi:hypothetical protein